MPADTDDLGRRILGQLAPDELAEAPSERHLDVLRAALRLFGERGYAGASLRLLAAELGMQQPSLYNYFDSKEQLVEQVITHLGPQLLAVKPTAPPPSRLEGLPRFLVDMIFSVYANPAYPGFVRFLFAVSTEKPRFRDAIEALYGRGFALGTRLLTEPFVARGEISAGLAASIARTAINGIGLLLIEEYVLQGRTQPTAAARAYAEDLVLLLEGAIRARPRSKRR
jgi:AcrR family transcriptional regulator